MVITLSRLITSWLRACADLLDQAALRSVMGALGDGLVRPTVHTDLKDHPARS